MNPRQKKIPRYHVRKVHLITGKQREQQQVLGSRARYMLFKILTDLQDENNYFRRLDSRQRIEIAASFSRRPSTCMDNRVSVGTLSADRTIRGHGPRSCFASFGRFSRHEYVGICRLFSDGVCALHASTCVDACA